jgi:hypothetical protein
MLKTIKTHIKISKRKRQDRKEIMEQYNKYCVSITPLYFKAPKIEWYREMSEKAKNIIGERKGLKCFHVWHYKSKNDYSKIIRRAIVLQIGYQQNSAFFKDINWNGALSKKDPYWSYFSTDQPNVYGKKRKGNWFLSNELIPIDIE